LPALDEVPQINIYHMISPSPFNPLGVKGAAKIGAIRALAAIVAAIDAPLRPFAVRVTDLPVTPARLYDLIQSAKRNGTGTG